MTTKAGGSMKIIVKDCPLCGAARGAGIMAADAASALREAGWSLGRRLGEVRGRIRLEKEIRDLREEICLQMQAVGEIMYAAHKGSPSDSSRVQEILEYVDGLHEELDAHRREQETLKGLLVCPACGGANGSGSLYCQNCGKPLSRK